MSEFYMSELVHVIVWFCLAIALAALGGFAIGIIYADNRNKADEAYSPKVRPDRYYDGSI